MELLDQATALSALAVLIGTELLKLIPVEFTSTRAAWVNAILSVIASVLVVKPQLNLEDLAGTAASALLIGLVAALAYNQLTSKMVKLNTAAQ